MSILWLIFAVVTSPIGTVTGGEFFVVNRGAALNSQGYSKSNCGHDDHAGTQENSGPQENSGQGAEDDIEKVVLPPLMRILDVNGNSMLDSDEIAGAADRLRSLDVNKDERIDLGEVLVAAEKLNPGELNPAREKDFISRVLGMDKNGDGKLSEAELGQSLKPLLTKFDVITTDGQLDQQELAALKKEFEKRFDDQKRTSNTNSNGK